MFDGWVHEGSTSTATVGPHATLPRAFIAASGLTVLLLLTAGRDVVRGREDTRAGPQWFEFTCEFQLRMGRGHIEGRMASDGSRRRVTVYWTEPDVFREATPFIRYIDLIFTADSAHYWIYPGTQRGNFPLQGDTAEPLLPREQSVDAIVRSALAIIRRIEPQDNGQDTPLEIGRFFRDSRDLAQYAYKSQAANGEVNDLPGEADTDLRSLNSMPSARQYFKERQKDGTVLWRIEKASPNVLVAVVTTKPVTGIQATDCSRLFDADTLGQSMLIPPAYQAYWSFDRTLLELAESTDAPSASRALCPKFGSCLQDDKAPLEVRKGMYRLWFQAALKTGDMEAIRTSVQAAVAGVREDTPYGNYRSLLELARCSGEVQIQFPREPQEWLRPLVGERVRRAGGAVNYCFTRLMPLIDMNKWFIFGEFFLDEIRDQNLVEPALLRDMTIQFEATRDARETRPPDPCELSPRVREYLARIDDEPPRGSIDMETLRRILKEGLATADPGADSRMTESLVDDVIRSIRLIAGEGPFRGDADTLPGAIERFSRRFQKAYGSAESIEPVLATFLGLSFYDLSTTQDHDTVLTQWARQSAKLQSQVNAALSERGLGSLLAPQEVADIFRRGEQISAQYVQDPLWPTHKFPLTRGEESMLAGRLTLAFLQQKALLDDVALKFRYGGASEELKSSLIRGVSWITQQLVCESGFIRKPLYSGVACDYQSTLGFTASIEGPLYEEGKRPREIFKAMKYFHLGQRLNDIVRHEQELATQAKMQESIE